MIITQDVLSLLLLEIALISSSWLTSWDEQCPTRFTEPSVDRGLWILASNSQSSAVVRCKTHSFGEYCPVSAKDQSCSHQRSSRARGFTESPFRKAQVQGSRCHQSKHSNLESELRHF